jgi:asparagine synthase (glutamine-hydrolysing)
MSGPGLPVYTLGFSRPEWDETDEARETASHLGCAFHVETLGEGLEEEIPAILSSLGEPFGDASIVPTWFVSRLAARHVKVVLSGDGGDELFAGYTRYQGERLAASASLLPGPARAALARGLRALSGASRVMAGGASSGLAVRSGSAARRLARLPDDARRLARLLDDAGRTVEERYVAKSRASECADGSRLLRAADSSAEGRAAGIVAALVRERPPAEDAIALLSRLDLEFYLPNDMLWKVDRASMAHSIEVRVPFLDHRLVELALGMPSNVKLRGMTTKWLLRKAAEHRLPRGAAERPKRGFTPPVDEWMRGATGRRLEQWLGEGAGRARPGS